jgi:hypothetical protein
MNLTSMLYKLARASADVNALRSTKTAQRRAGNKVKGRALGKLGFWSRLWK